LVGLNVTRKLSLAATVVATCALSLRSFRQQQHHTSSNNSRTSKVQEICCFQHEATGNKVFSRIEINCKEVVKVYVDGGRAVTTVSI
jgi:hypothetical protein